MPEPEPLFVLDSSVVFDLINGRLIIEAQSLPCMFAVPDIIFEEELDEKAKGETAEFDFRILEFNGKQVAEVYGLKETNDKPSIKDWFALVGAREHRAVLLTGDSELLKIAEANGVIVHGTLWILDELVRQKIIIPRRAAHALREIIILGGFLPQIECIRRFKAWGEESKFWEDLF